MSYNITSVDVVHTTNFQISRLKLNELYDEYDGHYPENSIFTNPKFREEYTCDICEHCNGTNKLSVMSRKNVQADVKCPFCTDGSIETIQPKCFPWSGSYSGASFGALCEILSCFDGEADLVLTYEGGDSFQGIRLRDHKVTIHKIVMSLGAEIKKDQ